MKEVLKLSNSKKPRAVFFDVDDTMYDHLQPTREALQHVLKLEDSFPFEQAYHRIRYYSDMLADADGLLDRDPSPEELETMRVRRFMLALEEFDVKLSQSEAAEVQGKYLELQYRIDPFPGARELIRALREEGTLVGLITNGAEHHQGSKIRALALETDVAPEHIFISGAVGFAKPDPRIFHRVNELTGTAAENCWYIGDSWRNDVVGASEAGWRVIWFNHRLTLPETEHMPFGTAGSYEELRGLLMSHKIEI